MNPLVKTNEPVAAAPEPKTRNSATQSPINQSAWPYHELLHHFGEAFVWIIVVLAIFVVRYFAPTTFDDVTTLWFTGLILAFALSYYAFIYRYTSNQARRWIKDLADVVFIGILIFLAKDFGIYLFTLFILPIASAALALNLFNSLIIAIFASAFIAANIILNSQALGLNNTVLVGSLQVGFLFLLAFFTRTLAIRLREEQSERRFMEEKIRQADQKIQDVEALEEEFVSLTAHQLNTPLSIIRGYSSMLAEGDGGPLTPKQRRYAAEINAGGLRLAKLVNDLLDIHHINKGFTAEQNELVPLNKLLEQSVKELSVKMVAKNIKVDLQLAAQRVQVAGNSLQLAQALNNLLDNAIKYSNVNDVITIKSEQTRPPKAQVIITIEDEGIGIPEDEQARIFQRFYRASNSMNVDAQGTGLGLYITKRVIEAHKGSISFTSGLNKGTSFRIRLPLAIQAPNQSKTAKAIPNPKGVTL